MTPASDPGIRPPAPRPSAWLALLRLANLPTVWTNVLASAVLGAAPHCPVAWALVALALSCSYLGGMVLNDLWDRRWDQQHRPDRPIPSGRVSPAAAAGLAWTLLLGGLALLFAAPSWRGLPGGGLLLLAIVVYDRWHKGNPLAPGIMASCRVLACIVPALALGGKVTGGVVALAMLQLGWGLGLTVLSRRTVRQPALGPLIPWLLAGISLVDGGALAVLASPVWLLPTLAAAALTRAAQRWAPGD